MHNELLKAADRGHYKKMARLIAQGVDINYIEPGGFSALMCSATAGRLKCLNVLLQAGADINIKTGLSSNSSFWSSERKTALMLAIEARQLGAVKILLGHCADIHSETKDKMTPLLLACRSARGDNTISTAVIEALLKQGAIVNHCGEYSPP